MPPSTEDQLLSLGERIRALETNMKVAIAIGVILGLGGAAIGTMLMSAGREAKTLQDSTAEMKQQLEKMKSDLPKLLYEPTEAAKKEIEKATEIQRLDLKSGLFAATITGADGTITLQKPTWITGVNRGRAGDYAIRFQPGIFTAQPICVCSSFNFQSTSCTIAASPTSATVHTIIGRDLADDPFSIICTNSR